VYPILDVHFIGTVTAQKQNIFSHPYKLMTLR